MPLLLPLRFLAFVALLPTVAVAVEYHVVDLGVLTPWPNNNSEAFGVNDSGMVVGKVSYGGLHGWWWTSGGGLKMMGPMMVMRPECEPHAVNNLGLATGVVLWPGWQTFLFKPGNGLRGLGVLDPPGNSEGWAVNDSGQVAGTSSHFAGGYLYPRAFFWSEATGMVGVPLLEQGGESHGFGLNVTGTVAGYASLTVASVKRSRAIRWTLKGGTENLGVLAGATDSHAFAVNSSGTVVGHCTTPGFDDLGFYWTEGTGMVQFAQHCRPFRISDRGEIVGTYSTLGAFSYMTKTGLVVLNEHLDLASMGWTLGTANDVNESGWIVGRGFYNGNLRAYLAIPQ